MTRIMVQQQHRTIQKLFRCDTGRGLDMAHFENAQLKPLADRQTISLTRRRVHREVYSSFASPSCFLGYSPVSDDTWLYCFILELNERS